MIREYLAVVTRINPSAPEHSPLLPRIAAEAASRFLDTFWIAADVPGIGGQLLALVTNHAISGRRVHDANIVATMLAHGITRLVTFNARDFRVFDGLIDIIALGAER